MNRITTVAITALHAVTLALIVVSLGVTTLAGDKHGQEPRPVYAYETAPTVYKPQKSLRKGPHGYARGWIPRDPYMGFRPVTDPGRPDEGSIRRAYRPLESDLPAAQQDADKHQGLPSEALWKGLHVTKAVVQAIVQ